MSAFKRISPSFSLSSSLFRILQRTDNLILHNHRRPPIFNTRQNSMHILPPDIYFYKAQLVRQKFDILCRVTIFVCAISHERRRPQSQKARWGDTILRRKDNFTRNRTREARVSPGSGLHINLTKRRRNDDIFTDGKRAAQFERDYPQRARAGETRILLTNWRFLVAYASRVRGPWSLDGERRSNPRHAIRTRFPRQIPPIATLARVRRYMPF